MTERPKKELSMCIFFFPAGNEEEYCTRLIGCLPVGNEIMSDAAEHISYIFYVLRLFAFAFDIFVAQVGDNCNTNKQVANNLSLK